MEVSAIYLLVTQGLWCLLRTLAVHHCQ